MIPPFASALRIVALIAVGTALVAATYPNGSADESARTKAKAFNPERNGALKVPQSRLSRLGSPNRSTWCYRGKPGVRIGTVGKQFAMWVGYLQLSKNYTNKKLTRSTANPIKLKEYKRRSRDFQKKGTGKLKTACRQSSGSGSGSGTATPLRFNIASAIGVSQGSASSARRGPAPRQASTGIQAVLADGSLRDAITSGTAQVSKVAVSPSGLLVVAFTQKVNLDNATSQYSSTGCLMVTVNRTSGVPACIDDSLTSLQSVSGGTIQFDGSGGIYYTGSICSQQCTSVLRRHKNGVITDLVNGQISISSFLVAPNGVVFMTGQTTATGTNFNRRYSTNGSVQNLGSPATGGGYALFADGNIYMTGHSGGNGGLARFRLLADSLDPNLWVGVGGSATNDWSAYCTGAGLGSGPCASFGALGLWAPGGSGNDSFAETASGKNFVSYRSGIVQVYPVVEAHTTSLDSTTIMATSGNILLLAGATSGGENQLVRFDTTTNSMTTLASRASANGEIEFYHVEPASNGYALFDGLRFNDNTYVIGKINYSTGEVTILSTVTGKLDDFKAF